MTSKRFTLSLAVIVGVFAALRIVFFLQLLDTPILRLLVLDSEHYYQWAARLAEGYGHPRGPFWLGPGYPLALSVLFKITGAAIPFAVITQFILSATTVILLALFTRRLFGDRVALATAALAALYAPWVYYDGAILSASLILFLNSVLFYLLVVPLDSANVLSGSKPPSRPVIWFMAGLICGLSALARPTILIFAVLLLLVLFLVHRLRGWTAPVLFFTAIVLVHIPISARNLQHSGSPVFVTSSGGINFFIGNRLGASGKYDELNFVESFDALNEAESYRLEASKRTGKVMTLTEASSYWGKQALEDVFRHSGGWLNILARKLWFTLRSEEVANNFSFEGTAGMVPILKVIPLRWGLLLALAVAGFFLLWRKKRALRLLGLYSLAYIIGILIFFSSSEYRFPLILAFLPLAGYFLVSLWKLLEGKDWTRLAAACAIYMVVMIASNYPSAEMKFTVQPTTDYQNLGAAAENRGLYAEALALYARALTIDAESQRARTGFADALWAMGNYDEARIEYELAGVAPPDSVSGQPTEEFLSVIQKYIDGGDYKTALEIMDEKFPLASDAPRDIWVKRAEIEAKMGKYAAAYWSMLLAHHRDPESPVWLYYAAEYILDAGNPVIADSLYREAIIRYPAFAPARLELGFLALEEGQLDEAQRQVEELRRIQIPEDTLRAKVDTLEKMVEERLRRRD